MSKQSHVNTTRDGRKRVPPARKGRAVRAQLRGEAALRQAEKTVRLEDDLLRTLAHKLRTPLNAMLGWARLLQNGSLDAEGVARGIEVISRSVLVQSQLITDIVDVSSSIAGKFRLDAQPLEMAAIVGAAVDSVQLTVAAKELHLSTTLHDTSLVVSGDAERLQDVVRNVLASAIDWTPAGGSVEVRLSREDAHVVVEVQDSGPGIPAQFLPEAFEPCRRTPADSGSRAGPALATARHFADLHGGTLEAASSAGVRGVTVTLRLPLAGARARP